AGGGVQMHHAGRVLARGVDRRVDDEAGRVDVERALHDLGTLQVDLDEIRGRHLLEHEAVGVDEEVMVAARNAGRNVGEDEVVPAVSGDEPVAGGEVDARGPFGRADLVPDRFDVGGAGWR